MFFAKKYFSVWERRLSSWSEQEGLRSDTQFGFRKKVGTLHNAFLLRLLIDKQRGAGKPLYVCFIDFEKAFDSAPRDLIIRRLEERGMH